MTIDAVEDPLFIARIEARLSTGWRVDRCCRLLKQIVIVQLEHQVEGFEVWYTDPEGVFLGNSITLDPPYAERLTHLCRQHLLPLLQQLLFTPSSDNIQDEGFLSLDCRVVADVLKRGSVLLSEPVAFDPTMTPIEVRSPRTGNLLQLPYAMDSVRADLKTAMLDAPHKDLVIPSPVNGQPLECESGFYIGEMHYLYRFCDKAHDLVMYMLAGYADLISYALLLPQSGVLILHPDHQNLGRTSVHALPYWFNYILLAYGPSLTSALQCKTKRFAYVLQGPPWLHIGHQLWNDLSGIEAYIESGRSTHALRWYVQDGAQEVEMYGRLDSLFPELQGAVIRGISTHHDLVRHMAGSGEIPLRFTASSVNRKLRQRLQEHARRTATRASEDGMSMIVGRYPVVTLGLRVENRTMPDLAGFYALLARCILDQYPKAVFLVDGRNASDSNRTFASVGQTDLRTEDDILLRAEKELLASLRALAPNAIFIDAVGLKLSDNLTLLGASDYFISPWGAGLAKYRWIWNIPGYIFTSRFNLLHRGDLHIYHHQACMEQPTPVAWINPELAFDCPEAPVRVNSATVQEYTNFWLDQSAAIQSILSEMRLRLQTP